MKIDSIGIDLEKGSSVPLRDDLPIERILMGNGMFFKNFLFYKFCMTTF